MKIGLDTTFLVEAELAEHAKNEAARALLSRSVRRGDTFVLCPQVLAEFLHVVTDPKRFSHPLDVEEASARAQRWWSGREVLQVYPTADSTEVFFRWMQSFRLGRKRILDTQLAAVFFAHGVKHIFSSNSEDFAIFNAFQVSCP